MTLGGCTCGEGRLFPLHLRHETSANPCNPTTLQMVLSALRCHLGGTQHHIKQPETAECLLSGN
jgi:hypothetical protein